MVSGGHAGRGPHLLEASRVGRGLAAASSKESGAQGAEKRRGSSRERSGWLYAESGEQMHQSESKLERSVLL